MPTGDLDSRRSFNMPGLTVTPAQMLDSLERLAGSAVRARVRSEVDERMTRVVTTWPGALEASRAIAAGFVGDADIDTLIREFMRDASYLPMT